jgi:hypothetical protein
MLKLVVVFVLGSMFGGLVGVSTMALLLADPDRE